MSLDAKSLKSAHEFLGLRRSIVGMLCMVILVGMGVQMADRFLPEYLEAVAAQYGLPTWMDRLAGALGTGGGAVLVIGALSFLKNLLGALYSYPGGYLAGHLGTKRALLVFNLAAMLGFALVIAVPTWWAVLLGAVFFVAWEAISLPAIMGLMARVLPANKRTMGVSVHSLVRRIPKALGPVAGGGLIVLIGSMVVGVRVAFAAALVLAAVGAVAQQRLISDEDGAKGEPPPLHPFKLFREMPKALRQLLISDILIRFCEQLPDIFVVVWCMRTIAHPVDAFHFGLLTAVEMATAMLVYIPVAYFADRGGKKPFVLTTFLFFTAFPLVLMFCRSFWPLVLAFVVRGLKEFGEPTRKALIMDLAPENRKAAMFGLYYLMRDTVVSVVALGGAVLWAVKPELNLVVACGCGVAGAAWFAIWGHDASRPEEVSRQAD